MNDAASIILVLMHSIQLIHADSLNRSILRVRPHLNLGNRCNSQPGCTSLSFMTTIFQISGALPRQISTTAKTWLVLSPTPTRPRWFKIHRAAPVLYLGRRFMYIPLRMHRCRTSGMVNRVHLFHLRATDLPRSIWGCIIWGWELASVMQGWACLAGTIRFDGDRGMVSADLCANFM